jgi:CRP-like cAMP-binding protein
MRVVEPALGEASAVLVEDPELADGLHRDRLAAAVRDCLARTIHLGPGPWIPTDENGLSSVGIGLLVLEGLVVRRVGLAGRFAAELLGAGDLLSTRNHEDLGATLPRTAKWHVLRPTRVAVLDGDFVTRLSHYPEVISTLFARALRRPRNMAVNMAIVQQPRIDLRLQMLFWELADRWGIVRQEGVYLPLHLTHSMLADLVAARRPTVTKALGELAERAAVTWTGEAWLLSGAPPAELTPARVLPAIANAARSQHARGDGDGAA